MFEFRVYVQEFNGLTRSGTPTIVTLPAKGESGGEFRVVHVYAAPNYSALLTGMYLWPFFTHHPFGNLQNKGRYTHGAEARWATRSSDCIASRPSSGP